MDPHNLSVAEYDGASQALRDYQRRSHRLIDRIMTERGASFARWRVLMEIARLGPLRSIDLAVSFGQAPRTMTETLDGLERDGLVRRDPDPDDRRAKRVTLTPAGEEAVIASESTRLDYLERVFGALSEDECREIVRILGKLNARLETLGG